MFMLTALFHVAIMLLWLGNTHGSVQYVGVVGTFIEKMIFPGFDPNPQHDCKQQTSVMHTNPDLNIINP